MPAEGPHSGERDGLEVDQRRDLRDWRGFGCVGQVRAEGQDEADHSFVQGDSEDEMKINAQKSTRWTHIR